MKKIFYLLLALVATTTLGASNVITYTATSKLVETANSFLSPGLHTDAFNATISSHTFSNGTGAITFVGEVTTIRTYAFYSCKGLKAITIPNSVTEIGWSAFSDCSGLTKTNYTGTIAEWCRIKFGNSYANPMYYSHNFYINDVEVKDLIIPAGVDTIRDYAFSGCSGLTSVTIPNSITSIGGSAFSGCSGLTKTNYTGTIADWCKIKFGDYLSNPIYYSKNFFINDVEVKDLVIPEGVDTIGDYAFRDCSSLISVMISNSVTTIGEYAFSGCSGLTSVAIPNSVTTIGISAFEGCSGLTSVTIPNSVTTIGISAFEGCSGLTSVTIPNSVTEIGISAFLGCSGLTSVTIGNSITTIGWGTFYNCSSLTSIIIPNSVTTIGDDAFSDCSGLTSVTIGNSVTTIGYWAFHDCSSLESITCLALVPPLLPKDTIAFEGVPRDIPLYVPASSIPAYRAAEGWKEFDIQSLLVDVDPITPDTTQLSWLPVDSASLYKLRIFSEQIELDTTLMIEADSLNGGIRIPVTLVPNRDRHMPMNDIGSVVIIIIEPRSGMTTETPFVVTVSTTSKDKINVGFDLEVLKGETTIKQESGSFTFNVPIPDGLDNIPAPRFGVSSGIFDLYGRHYYVNQWNQLPAGIYILRDGEKANKVMKR